MKTRLGKTWRAGSGAVNAWLSIPSPLVAEVTSSETFDSITIDLQHGLVDYHDMLAMLPSLRHSSATPMVRVPWLEPGIIMKSLDAGVLGVICPMINTAEDAKNFVSYAHYAPLGTRSFGPTRAGLVHGSEYFRNANSTIITLAMIETVQALSNLEEIVATEALTGVYIGPSDLSLSMGYEPKLDHEEPAVLEAIERILSAAHAANLRAGIHCGSPTYAKRMLAKGFDLVTLGSDLRLYRGALEQALSRCRE